MSEAFLDAGQRIEEQGFAESASLLRPVHGQACEQDDADGTIGEPHSNPPWTLMLVNGVGGQRVIAHHTIAFKSHVRSGGLCLLIGPPYLCSHTLRLGLPQSKPLQSCPRPNLSMTNSGLAARLMSGARRRAAL